MTKTPLTILLAFGTRPEAIKICPLVLELRKRPDITTLVCVTGQHRQMLDQVLSAFQITPDYDLSIMKDKQTLFDITESVLSGMKKVLEETHPDLLLVHGDTTTTSASALAAFYLNIPVGHVEAGLRTYNIHSPYPEEFNRQSVGSIASYHFAPTKLAAENLIREGKDSSYIFITGNTAIDAMKYTVSESYTHPELEWAKDSRLILITAHRRENLGQPMVHMFRAIKRVLDEQDDVKAIYPIHLNPIVRETAHEVFGNDNRIRLIEPLDVLDFHNFMKASYLILTDSGGIQEEAPSLGKPVLVMRDTTERPEGIEAETLKLVGTDEDTIYQSFSSLLDDKDEYEKMAHASNPYGDGKACERIADVIEKGSCEEFQSVSELCNSSELNSNKQMSKEVEHIYQSHAPYDIAFNFSSYTISIPENIPINIWDTIQKDDEYKFLYEYLTSKFAYEKGTIDADQERRKRLENEYIDRYGADQRIINTKHFPPERTPKMQTIITQLTESVKSQITNNDPPYMQELFTQIKSSYSTEQEAIDAVATVLNNELLHMMEIGKPFDADHYKKELMKLVEVKQ